jgi:subtilase family serine protease
MVTALSGQRTRYVALIRNLGASAAGAFAVGLQTPGAVPQSFDVESLSPGAGVRETFTGPACPAGSKVTATADAARQIDDANRRNNTLTVPCPSASSGQ